MKISKKLQKLFAFSLVCVRQNPHVLLALHYLLFQNDVRDLKNLFQVLGIDSEVLLDPTHDDLIDRTKDFGKDPVFRSISMLVYVVMAHGGKGSEIYPRDGKPINIEDLIDFFDDANCPDLKWKPKWFIFQALNFNLIFSRIHYFLNSSKQINKIFWF